MKVAIYCRLSEEDKDKKNPDDDSNSIQNQKKMLIDYAMQNDWEIYNIYSDDDYSGSDRNRPEFNRMITDAENRSFDIILCKAQSRFTRELELVEKYINYLLPLWGIRFIGLVDNADTANLGNKKARQITGLTNEWYIEDLSNDIKKVLHSKTREGIHIGSTAVYGYIKNPNQKGHIIIDPEAAEVVRMIFNWAYEGYSIANIVKMLNDLKIPNPSTYKEQHGIPYKRPNHQKGCGWKYFSVQRVLHNEVYIGNMVQGKQANFSYKSNKKINIKKEDWIRAENTHDPIIERSLFDAVQRILSNRSRGEQKPGTVGPFARKLKCAECGSTLRAVKSRDRRYFRCPTRFEETGGCQGCFISYYKIESIVLKELNKIIAKYLNKAELEKSLSIQRDYNKRIDALIAEIAKCDRQLIKGDQDLKTLYKDKLNDIITETEFSSLAQEIRQANERLAERAKNLELEVQRLHDLAEQIDYKKREAALKRYINVEKLDRTMVEDIIDYIVISKKDSETKLQEIEIFWNI